MDKVNFGRRDRLIQEKRHDVYGEKQKDTSSMSCEVAQLFSRGMLLNK